MSSSGTKDCNSVGKGTTLTNTRRGIMAANKDATLIATYSSGKAILFSANYSDAGVPTMSYLCATGTLGTNIDGVAFDYANNLYITSSSSEKVYAYSTPKATNTCTTPAASSRTIVLESYIPPVDVTGVTLDESSKTLVKGQNFTLTATVAPADATNKNVTWTSSDPTVASVSDGVVTALKKGTTTITVTTEDGSYTATCAITVELMHGTYNIGGAFANYASLSAAATAIKNTGIDGDVVLLVCADIAENANIGLVNNTSYSITIRPDAAIKRTITFGSQADNAGPSGHLMIGYDLTGWAASAAKNIYIDGSHNDEGQYLEFVAGTNGGIVACFYGHVTDSYIKNCRLINTRESGTNVGVVFRVEQLAGGTPAAADKTDNSPENIGLENCYIEVSGRDVNSNGIQFNGANAKTANVGGPTGCYIRDCEIHAHQRGIHLNGINNVTIERNIFHIQQTSTGYLAVGILGGSAAGTVSVKGNKFIDLVTANKASGNYGMQAIAASGGATLWEIENNYFAGMDATASTDNNSQLVYVRCGDPCNVRHNTFYMPSLSNKPATPITHAYPITCIHLAGANTYVVKNNIIISAETEANNSLIRGTINSTYVNNNIYFHSGGNAAIMAGGSVYKTWDEFTTKDANSKWVEPTFANAATGDLGIVESNDDLKVARLGDILTDMYGNSRPDPTYAGACEPVGVTDITGIPATLTLDEIGDTHTFTATVLPANTSFPTITWSSSNEAIATVTSAGVVTAHDKGEATITATAGGFEKSCVVTVAAASSLAGEYRIGGANADYASLHAACADLCEHGLGGDATFIICADLAETANSGIVNNSNHTLTIRPDGTTKRTITFGSAPDNAGPSGHVVIGYNLTGWSSFDTKNVIIDGSYNDEGQYLEFQAGTIGGVIVVYYGRVTNSEVRNCRLVNARATGTNYVAHFRTEKDSDKAPTGVGFKNCYMQVTGVANAQAVYYNGSQSSTAAGKPKDCYLRDCEIVSNLRGIFINGAINATFEGNTFRMPGASNGYIAHAIMGNAQTGTITVRKNKFTELKTNNVNAGSYGIRAITATGGATKWVIENNYFGGIDAIQASAANKNMLLTYIWCSDLCEMRHNTFHMPALSYKPSSALDSSDPIACVRLVGSANHIIKNNLFVSDETTAYNSLISGTLNDNILSNVFYNQGGNAALASSGSTIDDLDESNKWMAVTFADTYKLSFESACNPLMGVTQIAGITTDIEGRTRLTPTHAGCYEAGWGFVLDETATNNSTTISSKAGETTDVLLKRHFTDATAMYTLVLPFDLTDAQLQEAFGAGYKLSVMTDAYWKVEGEVLYLRFDYVNHLEAGMPALLQVGEAVTEDILFRDVTIDASDPENDQTVAVMRGLYDKTTVLADIKSYYLGTGRYLYQYTSDKETKGFRSYFYFPDFESATPCSARIVYRDEVVTDDEPASVQPTADAPQKLIRDGKVVIVVDGVEYDALGRKIQ